MYAHGKFINKKGDEAEVRILTNNDRSTTYEIGTKESGIYFTDDPIEIEDQTNDIFDVLLPQSASINLLVADFIPDFFQLNALNAKVNIFCAGKLVFAGYIEPQAFSQDFNEVYDELQLTCIDALSALQYSQYKGVMNSDTYASAKAASSQVLFDDILRELLESVTCDLYLGDDSVEMSIFVDNSVSTANGKMPLSATSINELLFFGDSEDDIWTNADVLKEILRYYNYHIRQEGVNYYVFDWRTAQSNDRTNAKWYNAESGKSETAASAKTVTLIDGIVEDCDTQISIEDTYNQIQLPCERKEISELAVSPLDESSLVAPFPRRTLYCTELISYPDDQDDYSYNKWTGHMRAGLGAMYYGEYETDLELRTMRDYYVQVFRNSSWTIQGCGDGVDTSKDVYDIWNSDEHALLDQVHCSPTMDATPHIVPCIVKVTKTGKKHTMTETAKETDSENTYLVIPVRGYDYYAEDTDESSWSTITSRCESIYNRGGLVKCISTTGGGSLSPSDEDTTNYIVIEGKVLLQQAAYSTMEAYNNPSNEGRVPDHSLTVTCGDPNLLPENIRNFEDRNRWISNDGDKTFIRAIYWYDAKGARRDFDHHTHCFYPPLDSQKYLQFTYNSDHDDWDTVDKVAILDCMMKVGDKYCVETFEDYIDATGHKRTKSIMRWLTEDQCPTYNVKDSDGVTRTYVKKTFSVGIDPDPGDCIIGQEHDIANTLGIDSNIEAKGTAIPIKASDRLRGKVEFSIIGPVNGTWNQVYRRHPTMFRSERFTDHSYSILNYCSAIYISGFSIGIYSDNGKVTNGEDKDLIYVSDEETAYRNTKECDDFKINSALTSGECIEMGVANAVCLSNPTDESTGLPVTLAVQNYEVIEAKPEQLYVDAYYKLCSAPKIKMVQNLQDKGCERSMFDIYTHPVLPNKSFFIQGASRNLMDGSIQLTLREI